MSTILVTGGAGYIGAHACKALAAAGYTPVVYDSLIHGHERAVRWGPLEQGDILDRARLDEVITRHRPTAVMHFAAFINVGESVSDPGKYYRNNVIGSLTLLEALAAHGVGRLIFSSTCATYGVQDAAQDGQPMNEETPQAPITSYGASKLMVERMLPDFADAHGLDWTALRYFNAAGADPQAEIGEDHDPETHLIPLVLDAAAGDRPSITIFGEDYQTPDGSCVRDYIHVADLADAHVRALARLEAGGASAAFNLGVGRGFSVKEVIAAAERVTGRSVPVVVGPRREGDPAVLVADARRAREALGWRPAITDLDAILKTAWNWRQRGG